MGDNEPKTWHPSVKQYIGKVVDQYVLIEPLGQGGMGLIFKAEQKRIKRHVAVKLLSPDHISNEVSIQRLQREATAMANLKHPHIATVFDMVISNDAHPWLIMELIEGTSLKTILQSDGKVSPERVVNIFLQVADAMDYAHANGLIHRDLKPDNIMLTLEYTGDYVKVVDFGIAKIVDAEPGEQSLTAQGQSMGSPFYMSPEQCSHQSAPDFRSDVYSLGVIMYECLTGVLPIKANSLLEIAWLKSNEPPKPFPPELKAWTKLETLTLACLAADPEKRPQTMAQVRDSLAQIQKQLTAGGGVPPEPAPAVEVEKSPAPETSGIANKLLQRIKDTFRRV
jgi:serine/threonine-protein kinase